MIKSAVNFLVLDMKFETLSRYGRVNFSLHTIHRKQPELKELASNNDRESITDDHGSLRP